MIAPGKGQALVAQPDRNRQGIQDGAEIRRGRFNREFFHPDRRHRAHGAAPRHQLAAAGIADRKLECHAAIGQIVQRRGKRQRIRALEAGIDQLLAAAIGEGAGAARPQTTRASRPAPRSASRSPTGATGPRAGDAQAAPQALGAALFGQCPERGGNRQGHGAGRQPAEHDQAASINSDDQIDRISRPGGGRQDNSQGAPKPRPAPSDLSQIGTHAFLSPRTRRK